MNETKNYTAADFARYYSGAMSPAEMHALERAALDDPFLADALEGYQYTSTPEQDVKELRERLSEKENKKAVPLFAFTNKTWMRIAAMFIVLAGAGYLFYTSNKNSAPDSKLAKNEAAVAEKPAAPTADTISSTPVLADVKAIAPASGNITVPSSQAYTPSSLEQDRVAEAEKKDALVVAPAPAGGTYDNYYKANKDLAAKEKSSFKKEYSFSGRLADETGAPVPFASLSNKYRQLSAKTDSSGFFSFRSADTSMSLMASSAGYESKAFTLTKSESPVIVLKENNANASLAEVVVVSAATRKKNAEISGASARVSNANISKGLEGKVAGLNITSNNISGTVNGVKLNQVNIAADTGLLSFKNFVETNARNANINSNAALKGKVTLTYRLDSNYRPDNIKVTKSNCKGCEEEAIRILQNAPVPANNNLNNNSGKNKITIRF